MSVVRETGTLARVRQQQALSWARQMAEDEMRNRIFEAPPVVARWEELSREILEGKRTPTSAAKALLETIETSVL